MAIVTTENAFELTILFSGNISNAIIEPSVRSPATFLGFASSANITFFGYKFVWTTTRKSLDPFVLGRIHIFFQFMVFFS